MCVFIQQIRYLIIMKTQIVLLFFFLSSFTHLPPAEYEVAWAEGEFLYQATGQTKWQKVESAAKKIQLSLTDKVKLSKGAQVIITAKDGSGYLLNTVGEWRLQQLLNKPNGALSPSIAKQYLGAMMKHINHTEKSIDEYAEGYMRKKGLVNRGPGLTAPLMVSPQYESVLETNSVTFSWKSKGKTPAYSFALYDDWNETESPIWEKEVADTTLLINLDKELLESDRTYYWSVAPKNTPMGVRYAFKRIKNEDLKLFEQKLKDLQTDLKYSKGMNAFVKAALYEENQFYPEANREFQNALRLEPSNRLFRQSYALFLARNGQVDDAKKYL
jgi:hypothetical protein